MENKICISFYLREAAIRLHRKSLISISSPLFVEFLVNRELKTFAVRSCEEKSLHSFRIRENINSKTDKVEFYSLPLCGALAQLNNWDEFGSYRVWGKAYPDQNIMIFDFSDAEIISDTDRSADDAKRSCI